MVQHRLDETEFDILKELANIGMGNAVTSLSKMLGEEKIKMDVPVATLIPMQDIPDFLGGAESLVAGVYIRAFGELPLTILFVLPQESAANLISLLTPGLAVGFDDLGLSVLKEVGNILIASYLNALSLITGLELLPTPPDVAIDMAGAIIVSAIVEAGVLDDEVVILKTNLNTTKSQINGCVLILPDQGGLGKIFKMVDVG